jgi:hypothetical protein
MEAVRAIGTRCRPGRPHDHWSKGSCCALPASNPGTLRIRKTRSGLRTGVCGGSSPKGNTNQFPVYRHPALHVPLDVTSLEDGSEA